MAAPRVAAVLLAAGASRRLGTPKQLLADADGVPLVVRAARQLLEAGCAPVLVVTGAEAEAVAAALQDLDVQLVFNPAHADGMGRSIAAGVVAIGDHPARDDIVGVLVAACDMPTVDTAHLQALMERSANGTIRTTSVYVALDGVVDVSMMRGIPAVFPTFDWPWLMALDSDRGAKPLLMEAGSLSVPLLQGMFDLDTPADVAAWRGELGR